MAEQAKDITPKVANAVFETPYYPVWGLALAQLRAKKAFARALTPELMMMPHPASREDFLLFFNDMPVGEVVSKSKLRVLVPQLQEELEAYFLPLNIQTIKAKATK